jgi:predicted permease
LADGTNERVSVDGSSFSLTDGASGTTTTNGLSYSVGLTGTTTTVTLTKAAGISAIAMQTVVDSIAYQNTNADKPTAGAWALCAGLGNTAFVGLPAIEALGGPDAARTATLIDQLGSFVAFSLLAVPFAAMMAGGEVKPGVVLRRVLTFPSFIALILAFVLHGVAFPAAVDDVLARFAAMLSPLALASVGWQLNLRGLAGRGKAIAAGLLFKEVLAPALVLGLMVATGSLGPDAPVAVTEAAMPPMVTAGVLATEHGLDRELASALIAVGLLTAVVAVPLWWAVVQGMI